jgi:predicted phage gp36 major capsid-like protein
MHLQDVDVSINENDLNNISEANEEDSREDKNVDESLNLDDVEALEAAMEASIARIQAMNTEIARLETKTAQAYELAAQKKAEARAWELKTERLKLNNLGGLSDGQISPAGLYLDVPTT